MSLREYLKELKIDQIEDDTEFCDKEYDVIMDYCKERKFLISDEDLTCIVNRCLNDSYEYRRAQYIEDLWLDFGNVPMNPNTECIEEEWNGFAAGTHRYEIWSWFEETYYQKCSKSYEVEACNKAQAKEIVLEKIENGLEYEPRCFNCEEEVFEIEEINEAYLIDGVTRCCGYDFGTDMDKAKFCPICGKKLLK